MNLKHGHIYFVEFNPSSGHEYQKMRPALILSSDKLIKRSNLITCVPFTGNTGNVVGEDDILVTKNKQNNLFTDSILKSQHISTFDKLRVKRLIGVLDEKLLNLLKKVVARNFDFNFGKVGDEFLF